jgi:hypothetical protein
MCAEFPARSVCIRRHPAPTPRWSLTSEVGGLGLRPRVEKVSAGGIHAATQAHRQGGGACLSSPTVGGNQPIKWRASRGRCLKIFNPSPHLTVRTKRPRIGIRTKASSHRPIPARPRFVPLHPQADPLPVDGLPGRSRPAVVGGEAAGRGMSRVSGTHTAVPDTASVLQQVEDCRVQAGEPAVLRRRLSVHGWRDRLSSARGRQLFGRACFGSTGRCGGGGSFGRRTAGAVSGRSRRIGRHPRVFRRSAGSRARISPVVTTMRSRRWGW